MVMTVIVCFSLITGIIIATIDLIIKSDFEHLIASKHLHQATMSFNRYSIFLAII